MDAKKYLVVGRGLVGKMFGENDGFDLMGYQEFRMKSELELIDYDGYVCAAAVSSESSCQAADWSEVVKANVQLPVEMLHLAEIPGKSVVAFSTSGVYRTPGVRKEADDVEPHNRYTTSKLMMEYEMERTCYERAYIFRIPFVCLFGNHRMDMPSRVEHWTECEDVETSMVFRKELFNATLNALETVKGGIYNLASTRLLLPDFIKEKFSWDGEIVPAHSMGLTPSTCLDVDKAKEAGLL